MEKKPTTAPLHVKNAGLSVLLSICPLKSLQITWLCIALLSFLDDPKVVKKRDICNFVDLLTKCYRYIKVTTK